MDTLLLLALELEITVLKCWVLDTETDVFWDVLLVAAHLSRFLESCVLQWSHFHKL